MIGALRRRTDLDIDRLFIAFIGLPVSCVPDALVYLKSLRAPPPCVSNLIVSMLTSDPSSEQDFVAYLNTRPQYDKSFALSIVLQKQWRHAACEIYVQMGDCISAFDCAITIGNVDLAKSVALRSDESQLVSDDSKSFQDQAQQIWVKLAKYYVSELHDVQGYVFKLLT